MFDILVAIEKIEIYTERFESADALRHAMMEWDATVREFEIIGEAANHLIKAGLFGEEKRAVVDFRNVLIHKYFGIDEEEVWQVIKDLHRLKDEVIRQIDALPNRAFLAKKVALEYSHQPRILALLQNFYD